jgi:hypothetical protein
MTMDVERGRSAQSAGFAEVLTRSIAGVRRLWRGFGQVRRATRCENDLAGLSDHMRRDLGLLPRAMPHRRGGVNDGLY